MRDLPTAAPERPSTPSTRELVDRAFARVAGAPLIAGNRVRLLKDAAENYPAWLKAIRGARSWVCFENYIVYDDEVGREFSRALIERAGEGVRVRVLYDWIGGLGKSSRSFWREMREGGVELHAVSRPRAASPLRLLSRDHRKLITVDGEVGFVGGLCAGHDWVGDPTRGLEPWRDTGIEIRGPAVAALDAAFAEVWETVTGRAGEAAAHPATPPAPLAPAGDVPLRVVASAPTSTALYRLDLLIAAGARERLWISDAYFVGTAVYIQALRAAARDGVDVRLLVPGATDLPLVRSLSRATYRPLLEAGVRIYEWNGTMMHAKTAVADGLWARVGSSNLNLSSLIGNWELDVAVEDEGFAGRMEEMYAADLDRSTEIVLDRRRLSTAQRAARAAARPVRRERVKRAAAGAVGIGSVLGAALTERRPLGRAEAKLLAGAGLVLAILAILVLLFPLLAAVPLALVGGWLAYALLARARELWHRGR